MSAKPKTAYLSANVDTAVLLELQAVSDIGVFGDKAPLVAFVQAGSLTKVIKNIAYFSSVNEIGQTARATQHLVKTLDVINYVVHDAREDLPNLAAKLSLLEQKERLVEFYTELSANLKVVYKMLGLRKPSATIALTRLLICLVEYKNHAVLTHFLDSFDFSHPTILKILVPTRDEFEKKLLMPESMRGVFVEFWLILCAACNASFRKALLTNYKNMNNFWKYVEMERYENLNRIIAFLDKSVFNEQTFKRATKCQILNENFIYNFRSLFPLVKSGNDRKEDDDVDEFTTFKKSFLAFMNTLVSDQSRGITYPQNEYGAPLVVNNTTFKINNKMIYTLVTALKPWDSYTQLQYVMTILKHNHELVPPYMNWIVASSGGYHDPSLTSYWIGHTLLYTEVLKVHDFPLNADYISLLPLSKSAMTECIAFPSDLVKQLLLQLVMFQLKRLTDAKSGTVAQSLVESVLGNLPTHASFLPLLSHENKLIKLTATEIVAKMEQLAPTSSSSAIVNQIGQSLAQLDLGNCDNFQLLLLDKYLSIQSNNDLKWWQKSALGNSFFTSLLQLSNISSLKLKIFQILQKLTKSTLAFNGNLLIESPLLALIDSVANLVGSESASKLWNCLDETISRTVKSPYPYLDKSHSEYSNLSVFVVSLFEQLKFIPDFEAETEIHKWLTDFTTKLVIIGEPQDAIEKLASVHKVKLNINLESLKVKENLISKFDFAEALVVLNRTVESSGKSAKILDLMKKVGNYLIGLAQFDEHLLSFISDASRWTFLRDLVSQPEISENQAFAITLLSELFEQLNQDLSQSPLNKFIFESCQTSLSTEKQSLLVKFLWILNDDQLKTLAKQFNNEKIVIGVHRALADKSSDFSPDYENLLKLKSPEIGDLLKQWPPSGEHVALILKDKRLHSLLDSPSDDIKQYLLSADNIEDDVLYRVAAAIPELVSKYQERVTQLALSGSDWAQSLRIFAEHLNLFDKESALELVFDRADKAPKESMSAEFVTFLTAYLKASTEVPLRAKEWIHKAMLYVTKKFAESPTLSTSFDNFLQSLLKLIASVEGFWKTVPASILNSQLEVLLGHATWILNDLYLRYANGVIFAAESGLIQSDKLLQLFITNEKNELYNIHKLEKSALRFQSALVIHALYKQNQTKSSTNNLLGQLLVFYLGSTRADDLLIKNVLVAIEKKLSSSWVSQVSNWDFLDEVSANELELIGEERLIIKDNSKFVVALNKGFVNNTIRNWVVTASIPSTRSLESFEAFAESCTTGTYQQTVYDPEFLISIVTNNDELMHEDDGQIKFNVNRMIDSNLLCFTVVSLGNPQIRDIAKVIIHGLLKYLVNSQTEMKDKNILKVYLSSILHTLREADHSTPVIWHVTGSLANILTNPGHFLYERVFRYVLSTPMVKASEIPLFHVISLCLTHKDTIEDDNYYKQTTWMITQLADGVKTKADLQILRNKSVLEWVYNLCNSPFYAGQQRSKVLRFLYEVQRVEKEGSDMMVTKYATLSTLEVVKRSLPDSFSSTQQALNIDQLALRLGILSHAQKRVRDWTSDNLDHAVKRIHST